MTKTKAQCPRCGEEEHPMVRGPCRHNGWKNYETWAVKAHIDNEEGTYNYWHDITRNCIQCAAEDENVKAGIWTVPEAVLYRLADRLKDEISNGVDLGASMYADLLNAALWDVDWQEIAKSLIDDVRS